MLAFNLVPEMAYKLDFTSTIMVLPVVIIIDDANYILGSMFGTQYLSQVSSLVAGNLQLLTLASVMAPLNTVPLNGLYMLQKLTL